MKRAKRKVKIQLGGTEKHPNAMVEPPNAAPIERSGRRTPKKRGRGAWGTNAPPAAAVEWPGLPPMSRKPPKGAR